MKETIKTRTKLSWDVAEVFSGLETNSPISLVEKDPKNHIFHDTRVTWRARSEAGVYFHWWFLETFLLLWIYSVGGNITKEIVLSYTSKEGRSVALLAAPESTKEPWNNLLGPERTHEPRSQGNIFSHKIWILIWGKNGRKLDLDWPGK